MSLQRDQSRWATWTCVACQWQHSPVLQLGGAHNGFWAEMHVQTTGSSICWQPPKTPATSEQLDTAAWATSAGLHGAGSANHLTEP